MQALANLSVSFLGFGVMMGLSRFLPSAERENRGGFFWSAEVAIVLTGGLLVVGLLIFQSEIAPLLYQASPESITSGVLVALGLLTVVLALAQTTASYFRLLDHPLIYGLAILAQVVFLLIGVVGWWWWLGRDIWVPLAAWIMGPGIAAGWAMVKIARLAPIRVDWGRLRDMVRFGLPLLPIGAIMWIIDFADRYLLTWLVSEEADIVVGIYTANYALGGIVVMVFGPFFLFYTPAVTRLWDEGKGKEAGRVTRRTVKFAVLCALPVVMAGVFGGEEVVGVVAGEHFRAHPSVMSLIMVGYAFYMIGAFAQTPLLMGKRTALILGISLLAATVNIGLGLLLIPLPPPWGGMQGAALATTVSFAVYLGASRLATWRVREFALGWGSLFSLSVLAVLGGGGIWLVGTETFIRMVGGIGLGLGVYFGGIIGLKIVDRQELWERYSGIFAGRSRRKKASG